MKSIKLVTAVLLVAVLIMSCTVTVGYDDYTWDGTPYTDADADGIPDVAETDGTSFYDMPLYDWGARPGVPDLFVYVAPMEAATDSDGYPDAGMLLQKKALDKVVAAFAAQGISVHFDVGKKRLYDGYTEITDRGVSSYNLSGKDHTIPYNDSIALYNYSGTDSSFTFVDQLRSDELSSKKNQIFYFMVFGSSQNADGSGGSSGIAYLSGRDFLITMANWGFGFGTNSKLGLTYADFENYVVNKQASTIMHEFGHNLGLRHGGNVDVNYKPNYYSIMNYLYQLQGLPRIGTEEGERYYYERYYQSSGLTKWRDLLSTSYSASLILEYGYLTLFPIEFNDGAFSSTFRMNYSHGEGGTLDETSLDESLGLKQTGSVPVDWDGSSSIETVTNYNINPSYDSTTDTVMSDFNDWGNLYLYYNAHHAGAERALMDTTLEVQKETVLPINTLDVNRSY